MPARVAAMMGAMVESAPTDINRLVPKVAKASEPAANAKSPHMGGMPTSRAVASCSGMAIAASVSAAIASPGSHEALSPRNDANQRTRSLASAMAIGYPGGLA